MIENTSASMEENTNDDYVYNKEEIDKVIADFKNDKKSKNNYENNDNKSPKKSRGKSFLIFVIVLIVVCAIALSLYFFVFKKDDSQTQQTGNYNIQSNNSNLGTITTVESDASNSVSATAYPKGNATFLGWAKGDLFGNTVISEESTLTISLDDTSKYYALFNLTVSEYTYKNINYTLYNEAYLATATGTDEFSEDTLNIPSIIMASNSNYQVYKIADNAFCNLDITSIRLTNNIIEVGSGTFANCKNLSSIYIPSSNAYYSSDEGDVLVDTATNFLVLGTTNAVIPNGVKGISDYAFAGRDITSIEIPSTVETIGNSAFRWCSKLESVTFSEQSKLSIVEPLAFSNCVIMKRINLPENLSTIGDFAFDNCNLLEDANISKNSKLISIGSYAFRFCSLLNNIILPDTLQTIGNHAFNNSGIVEVTIPANVENFGTDVFSNSELKNIVFENHILALPENTFYNCKKLESATLPTSIRTIERRSFYGCESLRTINIAELINLTYIGLESFYSTGLNEITIPDNLMTIATNAFSGSKLTSIVFSSNCKLTTIEQGSFLNSNLTGEIIIPNSVKTIGIEAFYENNLTKVTLGENITNIGEKAFANNQINEIVFKSAQVPDMNSAFNLNETVRIYVLEQYIEEYRTNFDSLANLGDRVFVLDGNFEFNNILYARIGENKVSAIDVINKDITIIAIGESITYNEKEYIVTEIGNYAFNNLANLEAMTLPSTIVSIGTNILSNSLNVNTIIVNPNNQIYKSENNKIILKSTGDIIDLGI